MRMRVSTTASRALSGVDQAWQVLYDEAQERLERRIKEYAAPRASWWPVQDIAIVYRIPNEYKGTLILPESSRDHHDRPYSLGLLMCAGPEALDVLTSHGVLIGDLVKFARFAGEEEVSGRIQDAIQNASNADEAVVIAKAVRDEELAKKKVLELKVPFIHGSVDLDERLSGPSPKMEIVRHVTDAGTAVHLIKPVISGDQ